MIEIFFCLVLHTECSILVSQVSNEIKNSTTSFTRLVLHSSDTSPFFLVERSNIRVFGCEIVSHVPLIRSNGESSIILSSISVGKSPSSLIESTSADTITLEGSNFNDLAIPGGGTFVSSGIARKQRVVGCEFRNMSRGRVGGEGGWGVSEEGVLMDSLMERCEDGIYGLIVSGLSGIGGFACMNSTMVECVRVKDLGRRLPNEASCTYSGGTCSTTERNVIVSGASNNVEVSVTECTFKDCSTTSGAGGALIIIGQSDTDGNEYYIKSVIITGCRFMDCSCVGSDDGCFGGGIAALQISTFSLSASNFSNCHTASGTETGSQSTLGGAVLLLSISSSLSVSSCIFDTCDVCSFCH